MKTVTVNRRIGDVSGLLTALRTAKPPFLVVNVGSRVNQTIIWLEDTERKDPTSFVEAWAPRVKVNPVLPQPPAPVPVAPPVPISIPEPVMIRHEELSVFGKERAVIEQPKKRGLFSRLFKGAKRAADSVAWWQKEDDGSRS